jgi:hypothetical protein
VPSHLYRWGMQDLEEHINILSPQVPFPECFKIQHKPSSIKYIRNRKNLIHLLGNILISTEC